MTIQQVIEKAIEGGYNTPFKSEFDMNSYPIQCQYLIDSLFWQALGKSMEWDEEFGGKAKQDDDGVYRLHNEDIKSEWLYRWHQLIDHLADGGTIESYFEQLS